MSFLLYITEHSLTISRGSALGPLADTMLRSFPVASYPSVLLQWCFYAVHGPSMGESSASQANLFESVLRAMDIALKRREATACCATCMKMAGCS